MNKHNITPNVPVPNDGKSVTEPMFENLDNSAYFPDYSFSDGSD